ncbi:MBL fold metallo-hydrolase [Kutzneria sp. CA-103260]|uniref:MBL fold metallo-hydrolase n=1 Tax=Kutzneria sp. CA-103260 TaxID=2802641 RepID=UPI001BA57F3B|nr:MBL fold metallo-hydrolase [Kutzneria sp. CA-103260]QUQ69611.1 beta-lactamase class B [Kutzneria sp. CA-103260]
MSSSPLVHSLGSATRAYEQPTGGWFLNNAGWVTGRERTLVVDTLATEARSARLLDAVRKDTGHDGDQLVAAITHWHGDHAHGAIQIARAGGRLLATGHSAAMIGAGPHLFEMVFAFDGWGDVTPPKIDELVSEPTTVDLGGISADVLPVPWVAHTEGDLVVHVPSDGVLFTGDLVFVGVVPLVMAGTAEGWIKALDWLATLEHRHLVPGHGPMQGAGSTAVADLRAYLSWLLEVTAVDAPDFDALDAQARQRWASWSEGERHAVNLMKTHADQHGTTADVATLAMAMLKPFGGPIPLDI